MSKDSWHIWVDTGGTFTDCIAQSPDGQTRYVKVLSNSSLRGSVAEVLSPDKIRVSQNWGAPDNFVRGLQFRLLDEQGTNTITSFDADTSQLAFKQPVPERKLTRGAPFEIKSNEEAPILACQLATGTLPAEDLPPIQLRLATTKATNALLEEKGAPTLLLITKGFGDFLQIGDQKRPDLFSFRIDKPLPLSDKVIEIPERLDANGNVLQKLDTDHLTDAITSFLNQHNASVAVSLMHSYTNNSHEQQLKQWLQKKGAKFVSCSSDMSASIKLLTRAQTTVINAYLEPVLDQYLQSVKNALADNQLFVMNSAAGLSSSNDFQPKDSLLSGPAGGVMGAAATGKEIGKKRIISLDMGGTSTDVARYDDGFDYQFEHSVGRANIKAPALSIETVAAGGGSICSFDGQKLTVGPDSAGAHPGPACYGAGGPLTLTDINLLLGRLQESNFNIPISRDAAENKLQHLINEIEETGKSVNRDEVLNGLLQIANERMADAIKKVSLRKGYDPSNYFLVAFGGAGAQHATAIASLLDMKSVLVPEKAGLLSAYGLGQASIEEFAEQQVLKLLPEIDRQIPKIIEVLEKKAEQKLLKELDHLEKSDVNIKRRMLFMRLEGQESTLKIEFNNLESLTDDFKKAYQKRYGHWVGGRDIEVESIRIVAATITENENIQRTTRSQGKPNASYHAETQFAQAKKSTPVYNRSTLKPGHELKGPVIILDPHSTTVVEPNWSVKIEKNGTLYLTSLSPALVSSTDYSESVNLELFTNRFTSIAEEMGEMMRRTALSVNVKERLDFSCALLNKEGELVVNAPHIPVHLGALGICVRRLKESISMEPGDVVATNHPHFGGSHLPDITVVTPIFDNENVLLGYAACRAHHAEIGGTRPGSMPPNATSLAEEGVIIPPTYLIKNGESQWEEVKKLLSEAPYPSRAIEENIADLQAAVAANHQGGQALQKIAEKEGADTVQHYMTALKERASEKTRSLIQTLPELSKESTELLDDGSQLRVKMEKNEDRLNIDFSGTADVHPGNLNATPAIVQSVIMYVLRCLIQEPIPLNEGLLDPVEITLPRCLLNPDFDADPVNCPAVVGGNTETSQRLVDLLLKPFGTISCSQGTMNNVLFGNDKFGYYETIGGGTGAGPDFYGSDAVHHHMTNTAGTDPEILEHRYPVHLERYEIRKESGGNGKHKGGNGITRELRFLEPVSLSVLTQHRKEAPYGLKGGKDGKTGKQEVVRKNGTRQVLNSIDGTELEAGDRFIIHTPGGGGFGDEN